MHEPDFDLTVEQTIARDPRYHRDAYCFLREALSHARKLVAKQRKTPVRHISGQQLLEGIREYALSQFGPMALTVLNDWGVNRGEDFGEIVFNMVEANLLSKTDKDSREDFKGGYTFDEAFRQPYLPKSKQKPVKAAP